MKELNESVQISESKSQHKKDLYQIFRITVVCKLLNRSKSMLYLDMNRGSIHYKPKFPKPLKISARSVGWRASEIYAYIDELEQQG